jgi:prepilin-type N-terminal cleavage/methylation domain-containing protein
MMLRRGFTLVEVLIAATILFASLAIVTESYRASLMASEKAAKTANMLTPLPMIVGQIQGRLLENPVETVTGDGEALGVNFSFRATTAQFLAPPRSFEPESGKYVQFKQRFRLYNVTLNLRLKSQTRTFQYQEIAWLPFAEPVG